MTGKPPYLGTVDGSEVFGPWENPLRTKQIHQSHIETLTSMCAKRFEFEYARRVNVARQSQGGSLAMGLGTASHVMVNGIVSGEINDTNLLVNADRIFNECVLPYITDPSDLRQAEADFKRNSTVTLFWISEELNTDILHTEKPFLIPRADEIVPGIGADWSFAGRIDLIELDEVNMTANIIDMKYRGKPSPSKNLASSQSIMYSMAAKFHGFRPKFKFLEIVKGRPYEQDIIINQGQIEFFEERVRDSVNMMESGVFPVNVGGWWCSERFCKWWFDCRGKFEAKTNP